MATASLDRTARIWDARTGLALTPVLAHDSPLTEVCFSPEGGRLLTVASGGRARMWDVESGSPLTEWFDQDRAFGAAFDRAGQRIALGGRGVHLWAVPRTSPPAPDWFLVWTEEIAGIRLDAQGTAELVMMSGTAPPLDGGFYDQLARWFLADPADRPGTPF
ncbi:MAG: hypothetical protein J0L84_09130 [Verrucomicrobia bacterium]|nr:hypothetical protein [Verrucomicrobiota bacterium]